MTYLLDTHYLLWAIGYSRQLCREVRDIITDPDNRIIVSTVSLWDVSLKYSIGNMDIEGLLRADLPATCLQNGFEIECLSAKDSSTFYKLKATYHKDPFDRMLTWQAIHNDYTLISIDKDVRKYASEGLKVLPAAAAH